MSQTDTIIGDLQAMKAGVGRARSAAGGLDNEAEKVMARAAAAGFSAIAVGMSQVRQAIRDVQARLGSVDGLLDEATKSVAAAPKEASPAQVIGALLPGAEKLDAAHGGMVAVVGAIDELKNLITKVLHGGDPGPMLSMVDNLKQIATSIARHSGTAKQSLGETIGAAKQIGASGD